MNIGQFANCLKGHNERLESEAKQVDQLNHILGQYIATSYHDPKSYPKKPFLMEEQAEKHVYTSDAAYERIARIKYGKGQ